MRSSTSTGGMVYFILFFALLFFGIGVASCIDVSTPQAVVPSASANVQMTASITLAPTDTLVLVPIEMLTTTATSTSTFVLVQAEVLTGTNAPTSALILAPVAFLPSKPTNALVVVQEDMPGLVVTETLDLVPSTPITITQETPWILEVSHSITNTTDSTTSVELFARPVLNLEISPTVPVIITCVGCLQWYCQTYGTCPSQPKP